MCLRLSTWSETGSEPTWSRIGSSPSRLYACWRSLAKQRNRVTADVRTRYDHIPWTDMVGLRNRLIHGYDSVDLDILWDILVGDLPPLVEQLRSVLTDLDA